MFALVKSLVQIAGTKKANGMQRNLPKSLQNLHLTGKKRAGAFSYQIVQTCFSGWFFQETAWRHEWLISGLVWPCNRIKLVNSIDKTEWFWNIDICCFVGSKHWKNVVRLQSSCSHHEVIRRVCKKMSFIEQLLTLKGFLVLLLLARDIWKSQRFVTSNVNMEVFHNKWL